MTTKPYKIGDRLDNGAVLIEKRKDVVLCLWVGSYQPYVTWRLNEQGDTYGGQYFHTMLDAAKSLAFRTRKLAG